MKAVLVCSVHDAVHEAEVELVFLGLEQLPCNRHIMSP